METPFSHDHPLLTQAPSPLFLSTLRMPSDKYQKHFFIAVLINLLAKNLTHPPAPSDVSAT